MTNCHVKTKNQLKTKQIFDFLIFVQAFGSGPYLLVPLLPSITEKTKMIKLPIYGTKASNKNQPLWPTSCSLLTATAKEGTT